MLGLVRMVRIWDLSPIRDDSLDRVIRDPSLRAFTLLVSHSHPRLVPEQWRVSLLCFGRILRSAEAKCRAFIYPTGSRGSTVALAAGAHEQGFTSLPVLAIGVAWLSLKAEGRWRTVRIGLAVVAVVLPSILMWVCFRLMNPNYGTSYVNLGLSSTLEQSGRRLAAYHIYNPVLIGTIKLTARALGALISVLALQLLSAPRTWRM